MDAQRQPSLSREGDGSQAVEAVQRGIQCMEEEQEGRAIECFTEAIRLCPTSADAYFARACAYDDLGDYDLAIADCTEVIRLSPLRPRGYHLRGEIYQKTGKWAKAERDIAKARRVAPEGKGP